MASGRPPFEIAGQVVRRGTIGRLDVRVARLPTGSWQTLPVAVIHGRNEGPVIWVNAAIHGDELNGIPVIRNILKSVDPRKLAGTVVAVPIVNVFGLINESRYLPDRRDLNRSFPGSQRGSAAAQLAHLFMTEIVSRCELGIDLHTGSGGRTNLPQIRCDLDEPRTRKLALEFGAPVILHGSPPKGSLRLAVGELGIPMLLFEGGEHGRFDEHSIRLATRGVMRVMASLGMLDPGGDEVSAAIVCRSSSWVRAGRTGFCQVLVPPGTMVTEGQPVAHVFDTLARYNSLVRSNANGIVIGQLSTALVNRGDAVAHIGQISSEGATGLS